ncbi:hypothetical protein KC318_g11404 [Hortaea werneckii]|nr:hypothetical protein KC355_g11608 [Hortaea werneckii]KAI7658149.1 hypothetical protein KC318_g11404 [Hortaea werneckii]
MSSTTVIERKPKNLAVHTNPAHSLHLVESDIPEPGPDDCLIHVRATGICGSDVHFWKHGHIGDMVVVGENGLGHESAGSVVKVGSNVTDFKEGKLCIVGPPARLLLRQTLQEIVWLLNVVCRVPSPHAMLVAPADTTHAQQISSSLRPLFMEP